MPARLGRRRASSSCPTSTSPSPASCSPTWAPTSPSSNRRAARRSARTGRSSTTSRAPSAASGGGTTTRPSAASSSTWPPTRDARAGARRPAPTCCSIGERARSGSTRRARLARRPNPRLVIVSITPFGLGSPRADEPVTDLTLLAEGGPAWSCGYDDHTLPPGARRRQPGLPRRRQLGGDVDARGPAGAARRPAPGQLHRREHARGQQRHDRDGDVRLADGRRRGAAPDRAPRRAGPDAADPGALPRRALRHDRRAAAGPGDVPGRARRARPPAACATSSTRRSCSRSAPRSTRRSTSADAVTDPMVAELMTTGARRRLVPRRAPRRLRLLHRDAVDRAGDRDHLHAGRGAGRPALRRPRLPRRDRAPRARPHDHLPRRAVPLHRHPVARPPRPPPRRAPVRPRLTARPSECLRCIRVSERRDSRPAHTRMPRLAPDGRGAHVLSDLRAELRPRRPRRRRPARQADARSRASGHQGLRLPQGPRRRRRPPRSRPPRRTRSCAPPTARGPTVVVGRGDGPHGGAAAGDHRRARPRRDQRLHRQPDGVQRPRHAARRRRCCGPSACAGRSRRAPRTAPTSSSPARPCSGRRPCTRSPTSTTPTCAS